LSIRYTLRHNIPSDKIAQEDVNDSSTWNLDLIRKHELAETDDYQIVYRQHDGRIVNWGEAANQYANEVIEQID